MANVRYWQASWVGANGTYLEPGEENYHIMWGFDDGDTIGVTVVPLSTREGDHILQVKDIQSEADPEGGRRFYFTISNTGPTQAAAYTLNFSFISA
jgi:hypothetical protein